MILNDALLHEVTTTGRVNRVTYDAFAEVNAEEHLAVTEQILEEFVGKLKSPKKRGA